MEKMTENDGKSLDIINDNLQTLKSIFPDAFTEDGVDFDALKQLHDEGITILLAEQHVYHALTLCDRAYVIETGRIVLEGTGEELLKNEEVKVKYLGG